MDEAQCIDENLILAYLELRLTTAESLQLFAHIDRCESCSELLLVVAAAHSLPPDDRRTQPVSPEDSAAPPKTIGRYVVSHLVGMGGMGVVYAGRDPELDRAVAIKLLRPDAKGDPELRRARLLREAQAMARLSHPNVITIYEAGTVGDQVFIAMELVTGTTLAERLRTKPAREEILRLFVAAGEGLAAAHDVGLVHRDFKPENVLVSADGRVRVTDFGLARLVTGSVDESATPSGATALSGSMTRTGALLGTPAYMAPEQLRREAVDPRTDVFCFCVALYEALVGARPFSGSTHEARLAAMEKQALDRAALEPLPRHVRRALERGLKPAPADRFQSMAALLAELRRDGRAQRRMLVAAGSALALVAVAAVGWHRAVVAPRALCRGGEQSFAGAWDEARRAAVKSAFARTGVPYADAAWEGVDHVLDAYRRSWLAMWRDACEATRLRGTQSEALLDLRMECLDERRQGVVALTEIFSRADAPTVQRAVTAAHALDPLDGCANPTELRGELPLPGDPQARAEIASLRRRLADVVAQHRVGRVSAALVAVKPIVEAAQKLGWPNLLAEALATRGELEFADDLPQAQARDTLQTARDAAVTARRDTLVAQILVLLVMACDDERDAAALAQGHRWAQEASAWIDRTGGDARLRARLLNGEGVLYQDAGRDAEAIAVFERAVAAARAAHDDARVAQATNNLGLARAQSGDVVRGEADLKEAVAGFERSLGPLHPSTATSLYVLGMVQGDVGELDASEATLRRAADVRARALRPDHPSLCSALHALARTLARNDKLGEALVTIRRARDCRPAGDSTRLYDVVTLADILREHDRPAEALRELDAVMNAPEHEQGLRHALVLRARADAELALGQAAAALRDSRAARALLEPLGKVQESSVGEALLVEGEAELALRRRPDAQRTLALVEPILHGDPQMTARARWAMARAVDDPARARALAEEARRVWSGLGPVARRRAAAVDAWLHAQLRSR